MLFEYDKKSFASSVCMTKPESKRKFEMSNIFYKRVPEILICTFMMCALVLPISKRAEACENGQECSPESENAAKKIDVERENIKPMWIGGTVSFSTIYVLTIALTAALSEDDVRGPSVAYAAIPLVGPFVAVGNDHDDISFDSFKVPLILSGIFQIASVGVLIAGLIVKRDVKTSISLRGRRDVKMVFQPLGLHAGAGLRIGLIF